MSDEPDKRQILQTAVIAVEKGNIEELTKLMPVLGLVINETDATGETLLVKSLRVRYPKLNTIQLLFSVPELNPNIPDFRLKAPPLFFAINTEDEAILKAFMADGRVNVNARDNSGETPLIYALLAHGQDRKVDILLEHPEINILAKNFQNETALDIVRNIEKARGHKYYDGVGKIEDAIKQQEVLKQEKQRKDFEKMILDKVAEAQEPLKVQIEGLRRANRILSRRVQELRANAHEIF